MSIEKYGDLKKVMKHKLNIAKLVRDLGGATKTAQLCSVVRTAPYGWISRGFISSVVLEKIKTAKPKMKIDLYFEEVNDIGKDKT